MPCVAQRTIRTSEPLTAWPALDSRAGGGGEALRQARALTSSAGMDRAPIASIVTPLAIDPCRPTRPRLPVPRDPDVVLGRDRPVPGDPDVRAGSGLPRVCAGDPNVARAGLWRDGLRRRGRERRRSLYARGRHVAAAEDEQRDPEPSQGRLRRHAGLPSTLARSFRRAGKA